MRQYVGLMAVGVLAVTGCTQTPPVEPAPAHTAALDRGSDRADWTPIVTGPADGVVKHYPTYFPDAGDKAAGNDFLARHDPEARALAALEGERPGNWNGANASAFVTDPLVAAGYTAILPVHMIVRPPWVTVESR